MSFNVQRRRSAGSGLMLLVLPALLLGCGRADAPLEPVRKVRTLVVAATPATGAVEYAAEIRARTEVRLGFRVPGKLLTRSAEVGQRVIQGQVLAQLDPVDLGLSQQAAMSAVHAAQVGRDLAAADFRRFKELRDQGFISGAELERRETSLKSATAQLQQAQAQAELQANQHRHATLRADAAGTVVAIDAEPGAVLPSGASVLRLALDGPRDAVFVVPEDAALTLRAQQGRPGALRIRLWAAAGEWPATVREVAAAADPVTRTFLVKAQVGATGALHLGQTASVRLAAAAGPDVIRLPMSAVREHQGRSAVWVVDPASGVVQTRAVSIADVHGNEVVVSSGLAVGERVVTAGVHVLAQGQTVRLQEPARAPPATTPASAPEAQAPQTSQAARTSQTAQTAQSAQTTASR